MNQDLVAQARDVAGSVPDPELPMLTLADLGILRDVQVDEQQGVVVTITPTYSGCPATATIRADLRLALRAAGFGQVEVRTTLSPAWSSDWISAAGRAALARHGIAAPGPARRHAAPVPIDLARRPASPRCPRCRSAATVEVSRFGPTPCLALHRCTGCQETFQHVKEL